MLKIVLIIGLLVIIGGWVNFLPSFLREEYPSLLMILVLATLFVAIPGLVAFISLFTSKK